MCITFFCSCPQTKTPLKFILAFNREEKTQRATLKLAPFNEDPNIYAGKDLQSGGTWLGMNKETGLLVFLTNYFMPPPYTRQGISRGMIVGHFLLSSFIPSDRKLQADDIVLEQLQQLAKKSQEYSPFNLVICNLRTGNMFYLCSEWNEQKVVRLSKGHSYGLSNSDIKTPWQKTIYGSNALKSIIGKLSESTEQQILVELTSLMNNNTKFKDLPDEIATIYLQPYWSTRLKAERRTKTTTLILANQQENGLQVTMKEITYGTQGKEQVIWRLVI